MELLFFIALFWVAPAFVAHYIGQKKNRRGIVWGIALGWIGVIVVTLLPERAPDATGTLRPSRTADQPRGSFAATSARFRRPTDAVPASAGPAATAASVQPGASATRACPRCGDPAGPESRFCERCGEQLPV